MEVQNEDVFLRTSYKGRYRQNISTWCLQANNSMVVWGRILILERRRSQEQPTSYLCMAWCGLLLITGSEYEIIENEKKDTVKWIPSKILKAASDHRKRPFTVLAGSVTKSWACSGTKSTRSGLPAGPPYLDGAPATGSIFLGGRSAAAFRRSPEALPLLAGVRPAASPWAGWVAGGRWSSICIVSAWSANSTAGHFVWWTPHQSWALAATGSLPAGPSGNSHNGTRSSAEAGSMPEHRFLACGSGRESDGFGFWFLGWRWIDWFPSAR